MQPLNWYVERLRGMSPAEVLWRIRSAIRDQLDRPRFALGLYRSVPSTPTRSELANIEPGFRLCDWDPHAYRSQELRPDEVCWQAGLRERAEKLLNHRINFFSLDDCHLGEVIDWNRDHEAGIAAPKGFAGSIDYRDYSVTGDAKIVWELNRHHHLVVLARAYQVTGDMRYAEEVIAQLRCWLQSCPFGQGMNWRSPLELAIRLINWVWAFDMIRGSGLITPVFQKELLSAVYLHLWEITRKYSQGSSANNHRVGEAAGVFIASQYFPALDPQGIWRQQSRAILCEEIQAQTYPDGANREQAFGYHLFVLQFFLLSGLVARRANVDFPEAYWSQVNKMLEFVGALSEGGDKAPSYGDCDDGYVLDLGRMGQRTLPGCLLWVRYYSIALILKRGRGDFRRQLIGCWVPVPSAEFEALPLSSDNAPLCSRAFPDSGHYLLQCGRASALIV